MSAANWERVDDAWNHCGRPAWLDDEGATCSKCQASMTWAEDQAGWVFHNLETGTVDGVGADSWLLDVDTLTADELRHLHDADSLGWFDDAAAAVVRRVGVPVSELVAAYEWRRDLEAAGILADVEDYVVQIMPDENPPCPVCHYPLSDHNVAGFPCDGCTESEPMGVWASSWSVES